MAEAVLNLAITLDSKPHHVVECARALHRQLTPDQFRLLCSLSAEVLAIHESAANGGTKVLVVPEAAARDLLSHQG